MGNQQSNNDTGNRNPFARGALGLSRAELDQRCKPSGLYDTCHWDERAIRKLVGDGKAAARLKGAEFRTATADHECPICFLYYDEINVTKCCNANICTECFLQVRPQKEKHSTCPFCNNNKLSISVAKKLSVQEILEREQEEKRAEEARVRARKNSSEDNETKPIKIPDATTSTTNGGFGSSLERDSRVAIARKRSESFASSEHSGHGGDSYAETSMIQAMAMTPEERRRLEAEMRNQNLHPLALQIEAEAQQRRAQHERNYHRSHSDRHHRSSRRRPRASSVTGPPRDWNQIVEAFERGGNGAVNSLDDLVVLEAAILLSMEEEARRAGGGEEDDSDNDDDFDAARHAREGFPLVRSFLASRGRDDEPATRQQVQNLARTLNSNRRRNQLLRAGMGSQSARTMPDTALDTAALLMRGISEEEQLAMAIAASLQDQNNTTSEEGTEEQSGEDDGGDEAYRETANASEEEHADLEEAAIGIAIENDDDEAAPESERLGGGEENADLEGAAIGIAIETDGGEEGEHESEVPDGDDENTYLEGAAIGIVIENDGDNIEEAAPESDGPDGGDIQQAAAPFIQTVSDDEEIPDGVAIGVVTDEEGHTTPAGEYSVEEPQAKEEGVAQASHTAEQMEESSPPVDYPEHGTTVDAIAIEEDNGGTEAASARLEE